MTDSAGQDLTLEARMEIAGNDIALDYRVRNDSGQPLFLLNILHDEMDEGGIYPLDPSGYVEIENDAVIISRKLFPVPPMMFVEKVNIPFATRLMPGETFQERIRLPLPVTPRNPYVDTPSTKGQEVQGRQLFFEIGYFPGAEGTEGQGRTFQTDGGPRPGFSVFTTSQQRLHRVGPLGVVPVAAPEPATA